MNPVKICYAIEIGDILCGYIETTETLTQANKKEFIKQDAKTLIILSLLGNKSISMNQTSTFIDPVTYKCTNIVSNIDQGEKKYTFQLEVEDNKAIINSSLLAKSKEVVLDSDVITSNYELIYNIRKDFIGKKISEANYKILDLAEQEIQHLKVTKIKDEIIDLAGRTLRTTIVEQVNEKTGLKTKYWFTPEFESFVKFEVQNRKVYLTDNRIADRIKAANLDASLITKVKVSIADVPSISYMKLKLKIESTGTKLESNDLTSAGQKFIGTISDNIVDGILEIEQRRYNGSNAPSFPLDYSKDSWLEKYIIADNLIESDDPVLAQKAKEITSGTTDSWEAVKRLGKWVAENISYSIPGDSARKTYDAGMGECGAHSRLLASFCRSVGLPCRIVFGAMYTPYYEGGFGQHAWNEVYLGEAGWIPMLPLMKLISLMPDIFVLLRSFHQHPHHLTVKVLRY
jgi:hypothetical protein